MKKPLVKKLSADSLSRLNANNIIFAELIFDNYSGFDVKIWAMVDDQYVVFDTTNSEDRDLKDKAKNLIAFKLKDNFCSTWDFQNYNRFYFLRDKKLSIDQKTGQFIYDNQYVAEADFVTEHLRYYDEKAIAKTIKQNFPHIKKDDLARRLETVKNFYFSSEPAEFYDRSETIDIIDEQIDLAKQLVFALGSFSVSTINLFFGYDHHADVFDSIVRDLSDDFAIKPRDYKIDDGVFVTLFESYDDYEARSDEDIERNARLAIGSCEYDNFTLVYDADIPEELKMAREFLNVLGEYCSKTNSQTLRKLIAQKQQLSVSEVLKAISFNGEVPYYSPDDDFDNFHNIVTRYMIESGWLTDFPKNILDLPDIAMLRLSIFKYILQNWNWIIAIYNFDVLEELAECYGLTSLKNSTIEEDALRRAFIRKVLKQQIAELEQELEDKILKMVARSERNEFFIQNYVDEKTVAKRSDQHQANAENSNWSSYDKALLQKAKQLTGKITVDLLQKQLKIDYFKAVEIKMKLDAEG